MRIDSAALNDVGALRPRVHAGGVTWPRTITMLLARLALFALLQALAAGLFALLGRAAPWQMSIAWWPVTVSIANLATLALLQRALSHEGLRYRDLVRLDRSHLGRDLLVVFLLLIPLGPIGYLPNPWLGTLLFGDPLIPFEMMVQPLPMAWAILGAVAFPISQGMIELVTYFGYSMPRLEALGAPRALTVGAAAFFLALQHMAVPLIFDGRFILWRALMFLPFALSLGVVLRWRPRLLPYLMVIHALIDMSMSFYIIAAGV